MIIIDEEAEAKLEKALEVLKAEPTNARCIHLDLEGVPVTAAMKEKVIASARMHLNPLNTKIYMCTDGDIFILASNLTAKDSKLFILDIVAHANLPVNEKWLGMYEVSLHINRLLVTIEKKLEKQSKMQEMLDAQQVQQKTEQKRHAILNGVINSKYENIAYHRKMRNHPEIMIIEDDAFSRRLVENVLQKKYSVTGIGEATYALDTYARLAPDLLFLDINLPDVSGHELLKKIIEIDPDAYVVMLSGNSDIENISQAMNIGAKGFIAKPFTADKLFQYINRCPTITA